MTSRKQSSCYLSISLFVALILFFAAAGAAEVSQEGRYRAVIASFEDFVKQRMAFDRAVGLSVGFIKDDFNWARGFGYADLENRVPARPESSYRLASVTKTFTALAVLQLVEQGKIDLDAEVQRYVPYFPKKKWPVTVRLLLGHLGGISHYKNYDLEGHIRVHRDTRQALAIFQDFDLVAEPGTRYHYSSYGFNLLGAVVEGASGQTYGDYLREHIFAPLGMADSRLDDPVAIIPNRVRGYRLVDNRVKNSEYVNMSSRFAGGGTRSTVRDMLKYARAIMDGKLVKLETSREMFTAMTTRKGLWTGYGMGWGVRPWHGHFRVGHSGAQQETRTYLLILPQVRFALFIASNFEDIALMPYVRRLSELVLQEDIDSAVFSTRVKERPMLAACFQVFCHGLSHYERHNAPLTTDEQQLKESFSFFNKFVDAKALKENYKAVKEKIESGIHPIAGRPFARIGSFMAACLKQAYGDDRLKGYHKQGFFAFFKDFIGLYKQWARQKRKLTFSRAFEKTFSRWQRDWARTYSETTRSLVVMPGMDFRDLGQGLKKIFANARVYPDFSRDMVDIGHAYLLNDGSDKAFAMLTLADELWPSLPRVLSHLAFANLYSGRHFTAGNLFRRAFEIDSKDSAISLNRFSYYRQVLLDKKKSKALFQLVDIALGLYPKSAELHKQVGDLHLETGQKQKALEFYKKALKLKPDFTEVKQILQKIEE